MKRIHIPKLVDIARSEDPGEIKALSQNTALDRAYSDRSVLLNALVLGRVKRILQIDRRPFPTVAPRDAPGRASAQDALWNRLNALVPRLSEGPDELESLALYVRGAGAEETCGPLVQEIVGRLFMPAFKATQASWEAAVVLEKAPRMMNPVVLAWWSVTNRVERSRDLLSGMVGGDTSAVHAVGIALHNIVSGVQSMRQIFANQQTRASMSPEAARTRCLFAPASVLRQATASVQLAQGDLNTGTVLMLNLQAANSESPDPDIAFLRNTWSRCPAERWVPALLEGVWRRACRSSAEKP